MSLSALRDALPPYAADLGSNLDDLADDRELAADERWGCFVACALAAAEPTTLRELLDGAAETLGERSLEAVKAAFAITAMNNVYYGALGQLKNAEYANMPAHLRMEVLAHPGVDKATFDLWCLSVSALNGCGPCMDAQEEELRRRATPPSRIQTAMRIAAVTGAVARVLAAEAALADPKDEKTEQGDGQPDQEEGGERIDDATADGEGADAGKADKSAGPAAAPPPQQPAPPSPEELAKTPQPAPAPAPAPAPGDVASG